MKDGFGRTIDYMRVSITDRCNLRCKYCMPDDLEHIPHEDILRYEELLRICRAAAASGVRNLRITGGEPLVRLGCVDFIRRLKALEGIEHVTLTTNGVLLEQHLDELADIGIDGVNISLDTLDPAVYAELTGRDELDRVLSGLRRALELGIGVKINCVPLSGINSGGLLDVAGLARRYPLDVRFIEAMPIGYGRGFRPVAGGRILAELEKAYPNLRGDTRKRGFGPARYYVSADMPGSVGFINALSHGFCKSCNRLRVTSEGFLKLCLYHGYGVDLRALLRGGAGDDRLRAAFRAAIEAKPEKHFFRVKEHPSERKEMSRIGG